VCLDFAAFISIIIGGIEVVSDWFLFLYPVCLVVAIWQFDYDSLNGTEEWAHKWRLCNKKSSI
jgi:hypothetical protein